MFKITPKQQIQVHLIQAYLWDKHPKLTHCFTEEHIINNALEKGLDQLEKETLINIKKDARRGC